MESCFLSFGKKKKKKPRRDISLESNGVFELYGVALTENRFCPRRYNVIGRVERLFPECEPFRWKQESYGGSLSCSGLNERRPCVWRAGRVRLMINTIRK